MVEISNNLIAGLLLVAIVISGYSVLTAMQWEEVKITGFTAQGGGTANVTIGGVVDIVMIRNLTDFDSSNLGGSDQQIETTASNGDNPLTFDDGTEGNSTNAGTCDNTEGNCAFPFVVQNNGNVNVSININATQEAWNWIATGARAYVLGKSNESGATNYTGSAGFGEGSWIDLNVTSTAFVVDNLGPLDPRDSARIHIRLWLRSDTPATSYGEYLTVGAQQIVT